MNRALVRQAATYTAPIFFGYLAIGIPFGLMVVNSGYPWWLSLFMSIFMYSGAGQYIAIGLFASGAGLAEIAVTELFLNIRHIVYGLSLIEKCRGSGKWKPFIIYWLTDETYALLCSTDIPPRAEKGPFLGTIAFLDYFYWVLGSVIGALVCNVLKYFNLAQYLSGVDFALTALFAIILCSLIQKSWSVPKEALLPALTGIFSCILSVLLFKMNLVPSSNIIFLSILLGIALIVLLTGVSFYKQRGKSAAAALVLAGMSLALAIIVFAAGYVQPGSLQEGTASLPLVKEKVSLGTALAATFICGFIIFFERAFSFILFSKKEPPPLIGFIEKYIPSMIIAILLTYCMKDVQFSSFPYGLPSFVALAFAVAMNLTVKNSMVSIFGSTAVFMILTAIM